MTKKLLLFGLIALILSACKPLESPIAPADRAYNLTKYYTAISLYKRAASTGSRQDRNRALFQLGECYRKMNDTKNAALWYEKCLKAGNDTLAIFKHYGEILKNQDRMEEAEEMLQTYARLSGDSSGLISCRLAIKWKKKEINFEVFNESGLNSKSSDFAPAYLNDKIVFTSTREPIKGKNMFEWTGKGYLNLYTSKIDARNKWSKPQFLGKDVNSDFNDGVATYDPQRKALYYTQCNGANGKKPDCKIFVTFYDGKNWSKGRRIDLDLDTTINLGNPSLAKDGRTLYFVSDMPGGYGENDLYVTKLGTEKWSAPVNLGPEINTAEDDDFPFIHPSGVLYFASKGHPGMGGLDLFYSEPDSAGKFKKPINLKYPTNSTSDDFGLILNESKEEGYFASNRPGGKGDDDIYSAVVIPPVFTISGRAFNTLNKKVLKETNITLRGNNDKEVTAITDRTGFYKFELDKDVYYYMTAQKNGFFGDNAFQSTIGLKESTDLVQDFYLTPIPKVIVLKGILYDLDKADLRPVSMVILDSLVKTLNENPNITIELSSHTDSRSDSAYNLDLSQRRAQSVVDYLISKNIDADRLVAKGYGETRLLNGCADGIDCTEEEHQLNRRTELRILSENYVSKKQKFDERTAKPIAPPTTPPAETKPKE